MKRIFEPYYKYTTTCKAGSLAELPGRLPGQGAGSQPGLYFNQTGEINEEQKDTYKKIMNFLCSPIPLNPPYEKSSGLLINFL
jgi:hypothetical protein